jgi:hypothetical protein
MDHRVGGGGRSLLDTLRRKRFTGVIRKADQSSDEAECNPQNGDDLVQLFNDVPGRYRSTF